MPATMLLKPSTWTLNSKSQWGETPFTQWKLVFTQADILTCITTELWVQENITYSTPSEVVLLSMLILHDCVLVDQNYSLVHL